MKLSEISLLYEDEHYLFLNKKPGIPSLPDKSGDISFLELAEKKKGIKLFPLSRLDRPVSGVLVFSKSKSDTTRFWKWNANSAIRKVYLAIVEYPLKEKAGKIEEYLVRDGRKHKAKISSKSNSKAKKAVLEYKHLYKLDRYQLYQIHNLSGRFHQIRALFSNAGAPVKGDVKYGARRKNKNRSIHLHCWGLHFEGIDPSKPYHIQAPLPEDPLWNVIRSNLDLR